MLNGRTLKFLTVPGGVLLLGVAILLYSGWLTLALPALSFLYYSSVVGGMLLAWRFHSSRIFLAVVVLFLAQQAIAVSGAAHASSGSVGAITLTATAMLVPVNFVLIAMVTESGFVVAGIAPFGIFLFVQVV